MNKTKRLGAALTITAVLAAVPATASAQPDPYERAFASPQKVAKVVRDARMVPRPGARVLPAPCGTPSKAARLVRCGARSFMMARPYGRG